MEKTFFCYDFYNCQSCKPQDQWLAMASEKQLFTHSFPPQKTKSRPIKMEIGEEKNLIVGEKLCLGKIKLVSKKIKQIPDELKQILNFGLFDFWIGEYQDGSGIVYFDPRHTRIN